MVNMEIIKTNQTPLILEWTGSKSAGRKSPFGINGLMLSICRERPGQAVYIRNLFCLFFF